MEGFTVHSAVMTEIAQRQTAADLDARRLVELRASAAATIGKLDAWLAVSTPIEHRTTTPGRCGYCGANPCRRGDDACCAWSAGLVEFRTSQPGMTRVIDGELCMVECRPCRRLSVR